jgi:23S rRNA (adenine2503-C2)-methyltransferase
MEEKLNLLNLTIPELQDILQTIGQQKFRAKQIFQWLHRGIKSFDEMSDLSKPLRQELAKIAYIGNLKIKEKLVSKIDGTRKYLFELEDGNIIESVLMEYNHGKTACLTSQIGCRMGCKFCASTGIGFIRDLSAGEILDQILSIQNDINDKIGNIVIMGIGEPFDNYDNVIKFLKLIHESDGLNIGYRRITISTCGLIPEIEKFTHENIPVNLSISLHAPNDEARERTMPVNKKYPIDKLIEACKIYTGVSGRRITFEYALISGINDSKEYAVELATRLKSMLCHVNLIPVNSIKSADFKRSDRKHIDSFKEILEGYGIETTVRRELGNDISAACGQLRRSAVEDLE